MFQRGVGICVAVSDFEAARAAPPSSSVDDVTHNRRTIEIHSDSMFRSFCARALSAIGTRMATHRVGFALEKQRLVAKCPC